MSVNNNIFVDEDTFSDIDTLSDHACRLIEHKIASAQTSVKRNDRSALTAKTVVQYLSNSLSTAESRLLERSLVADKVLRAKLSIALRQLDQIQTQPLKAMVDKTWASSFEQEVSDAWFELVNERLLTAQTSRAAWLEIGWNRLKSLAERGAMDAQAAWSSIYNISTQLNSLLNVRTFAVARSGETLPLVGVNGAQLPLSIQLVQAEISQNGALVVSGLLVGLSDEKLSSLNDLKIELNLNLKGIKWPLEAVSPVGNELHWTLQGFGGETGLPTGDISAELLSFSLSDQAKPELTTTSSILLDTSRSSQLGVDSLSQAEIKGPAYWSADGYLSVSLAIDPETVRTHPDQSVALNLGISDQSSQRIGEWPLSLWPTDGTPITITALCPPRDETVEITDFNALFRLSMAK